MHTKLSMYTKCDYSKIFMKKIPASKLYKFVKCMSQNVF